MSLIKRSSEWTNAELETYCEKEKKRAKKLFNKSKHTHFQSGDQMSEWFVKTLQEQKFKCCYCDTSIFDIHFLIYNEKIKPRSVRGGGFRGPVLEIDRNENAKGYIQNNCVLACYYCNNDKSYTMAGEEYKKYFGNNRKVYFDRLLATVN